MCVRWFFVLNFQAREGNNCFGDAVYVVPKPQELFFHFLFLRMWFNWTIKFFFAYCFLRFFHHRQLFSSLPILTQSIRCGFRNVSSTINAEDKSTFWKKPLDFRYTPYYLFSSLPINTSDLLKQHKQTIVVSWKIRMQIWSTTPNDYQAPYPRSPTPSTTLWARRTESKAPSSQNGPTISSQIIWLFTRQFR